MVRALFFYLRMFFSPLEQFQVYPLISFKFRYFNFSFTNLFLVLVVVTFSFLFCLEISLYRQGKINVIPNNWQTSVETVYRILLCTFRKNIKNKGQFFFPFVYSLSIFTLVLNLSGLIPCSISITSHFIATVGVAFAACLNPIIVSFKRHGLLALTLFIPVGIPLHLSFILVPIEIISNVFKPLSLGIRLFANITSGHVLLKTLALLAWSFTAISGILSPMYYFFPAMVLVVFIVLKLFIVAMQSYIFTLLVCFYINDFFINPVL